MRVCEFIFLSLNDINTIATVCEIACFITDTLLRASLHTILNLISMTFLTDIVIYILKVERMFSEKLTTFNEYNIASLVNYESNQSICLQNFLDLLCNKHFIILLFSPDNMVFNGCIIFKH